MIINVNINQSNLSGLKKKVKFPVIFTEKLLSEPGHKL